MQTDDTQQNPTDTAQQAPAEDVVVAHLRPDFVSAPPANNDAAQEQSWKDELPKIPGVDVMPNA